MAGILKRHQVELESRQQRSRPLASADPTCAQKSVRLIRVSGEVRAIEFTCDCGERSVIEIQLESEPKARPAPSKP